MRVATVRRWTLAGGVSALLAGSLLASYAGGPSGTPQTAEASTKVTLTINVFGEFGYQDLYAKYEAMHPGITVKENVTDNGLHHGNLHAHLLARSGTADIEAIEVEQISGFQPHAADFVNFLDHGVTKDQWVESKWKPATSVDGTSLFGLGTDLGGMALAYRTDLFKAAGLPTRRRDVSALISDWKSYVEVGRRFQAGIPDKSVNWFDTASHLQRAILAQSPEAAYDEQGNVIVGTNPAVKQAWDTVVTAIEAGQSAGLTEFTPPWEAGLRAGKFATVVCPAWMTTRIMAIAPETSGKWDLARIPGTGGGNWGGSYLTVPKASTHQDLAIDLAKWLTAPEQQKWVFINKGNFPSDKALWDQPEVQGYTNPFFSNAPEGKIFSESAKNLKPQILGPHTRAIGDRIGMALTAVERDEATPEEAWDKAKADVTKLERGE